MNPYSDYLMRHVVKIDMTREKDEAIALACRRISDMICTHELSTAGIRQMRAVEVSSFLEDLHVTLDKVQDQVDFIREFLPEDLR